MNPDGVSCKSVSIPEDTVSLALVRCYSAHATASHAQDCPDWRLEKTFFSHGNCINVFIPGTPLSLWFWSGVIMLMLRHHMHKTVLTGSWRELYPQICLFQEYLLWSWPGVIVFVLWRSTHKTITTRGQRLVYVLMIVITHKLIRAGWTHLVKFLRSFYKLFVRDIFWSLVFMRALPCLCFGIYTHNTVPFGSWRPKVFHLVLYKMSKVQKQLNW